MTPPHLRPWQEDCLAKWFENGCRGIVNVATGAGKTYLAVAAAFRLMQKKDRVRVKILVPTVFLAGQWRGELMRAGVEREDIALYHGTVKEDARRPFVIYVINTARGCVARHILRDARDGYSVLLICDECHHMGSPENARAFEFLPHIPEEKYFSLGLSATPEGENYQEVVLPALGKEIYRYSLAEASRDRVTAGYTVFSIAVDLSSTEAAAYEAFTVRIIRARRMLLARQPALRGGDFLKKLGGLCAREGEIGAMARGLRNLYLQRSALVHTVQSRLSCAMALTRNLIGDQRMIVFTERIEITEALYDRLNALYPGRVCRYHSGMEAGARACSLGRYRDGEANVLLCCHALDEGLDVPDTDAGILLSSGSGGRRRIQRMGRILRAVPDGRLKSVYYLHIPEAGEASAPLPDSRDVLELAYRAGEFTHPEYDALAELVRKKLRSRGAGAEQLRAAEAAIGKGRLRGDFMLPVEECERRVAGSAVGAERDYAVVMLMMARVRKGREG